MAPGRGQLAQGHRLVLDLLVQDPPVLDSHEQDHIGVGGDGQYFRPVGQGHVDVGGFALPLLVLFFMGHEGRQQRAFHALVVQSQVTLIAEGVDFVDGRVYAGHTNDQTVVIVVGHNVGDETVLDDGGLADLLLLPFVDFAALGHMVPSDAEKGAHEAGHLVDHNQFATVAGDADDCILELLVLHLDHLPQPTALQLGAPLDLPEADVDPANGVVGPARVQVVLAAEHARDLAQVRVQGGQLVQRLALRNGVNHQFACRGARGQQGARLQPAYGRDGLGVVGLQHLHQLPVLQIDQQQGGVLVHQTEEVLLGTGLQQLRGLGELGFQGQVAVDGQGELLHSRNGVEGREQVQQGWLRVNRLLQDLVVGVHQLLLPQGCLCNLAMAGACLQETHNFREGGKLAIVLSLGQLPSKFLLPIVNFLFGFLLCILLLTLFLNLGPVLHGTFLLVPMLQYCLCRLARTGAAGAPKKFLLGQGCLGGRVVEAANELFDHLYLCLLPTLLSFIRPWAGLLIVMGSSALLGSSLQLLYNRLAMNFVDSIRELCPKTTLILQVIGALIIAKKLFTLLSRLYKLFRKRKNLVDRYGRNTWAFVTGSSEGIGKALALSLAKEGFNVIISARTVSKLEEVEKEIKSKYPGREVRILVADYKKGVDWNYINDLLQEISDLDISIVVNNVGIDVFDKYVDLDPDHIKDVIALNCFPVAFINRYFLPLFDRQVEQGKKRAIVNISSVAGTIPMSYYQVYAAAKAFVDRFSQSLNHEHPGIDILSIRPSEVSTPMTCNKEPDIFTIMPEQCAEGILDQLGHEKASYGHWKHQLQGWLYEAVPESLFMFIFHKTFVHEELHRRKSKKGHKKH